MIKVKRVRTVDAVVIGWRPGKAERTVGALILGLYDGDAPARGRPLQRLHRQGEARARRLPGAVRDRRARERRGQPLDPGARARMGRPAPRARGRDHLRPRLRRAHPPRVEGPALARGQAPGGLHRGPARPVAAPPAPCARSHRIERVSPPPSRNARPLPRLRPQQPQPARWIALTELGHDVEVAVVDSGAAMEAAVARHRPDLIVCPMLKKLIPESIWSPHRCLVVHPGPRGDRGPSSLDWAIELGAGEWGVTVLEADGDFDAGDGLGHPHVPHARGRQEQPLPPRGPPRRGRGARRGGRARRRRRRAPEPPTTATRTSPAGPPAHDPGRPRHRLGRRLRPTRSCASIRAAEGHPGVLDTIDGHRVPPLRRPPRARAARRARRDRRPARRRDLPRDDRRRGLDHAPQAPRGRRSSSPPRARSRSPASSSTRPRSRSPLDARCPPSTPSARSPTRSTRASATCTSTSTTAR